MKKAIQIQHNEITEKLFDLCRKAGYKHISMGFGSSRIFHSDEWKEEILRLKIMMKSYNLECVQTHLPYYDLRIDSEKCEPEMETALKRCIEATSMLGAGVCAVHPRSAFDHDFSRLRAFEDNRRCFESYIPTAEENNVIIAIENMPLFPPNMKWKFYCWSYEDLIELCDSFESENIGICWDFGHAHLASVDQLRGLQTVGKRLVCTHIHDNFGNGDYHLIPGTGTIEWEDIMPIVRKIGYNGPLTLEIDYKDIPTLESYINHSFSCVEYLETMMNGE